MVLRWGELVGLPDAELGRLDVAAVNLACAAGLPGAERIDHDRCLRTLDRWAGRVRQLTERHLPAFHADPASYNDSEGYFRCLALVTVLQRDLGVRYDPAKVPEDAPFDAADTFVHGALRGGAGTCASLPVVYAAVGRRLGYPLRLVKAPRHLFARWDGPGGERLNVEATSRGLVCHPDEYYRTGRFAVPPQEERACGFLLSQTPRQELSGFLSQRGLRWAELGRHREAAEAFAWSVALHPEGALPRRCLGEVLGAWAGRLGRLLPPGFPRFGVRLPPRRRYPAAVPEAAERRMVFCEQLEACLADPRAERRWWGPLRHQQAAASKPPTLIEVRVHR